MEGETGEINGNYAAIQRATDACQHESRYLQGFCRAVDQSENKTEGYREAARRGNGKTVEMAMMELLRAAQPIAADPLVAPNHITALQDALREVEGLPSSLEEEAPGASCVMNNSGSGSQFLNSGRGSMNNCTGGFMVTGPSSGAKFEYASKEDKGK
ncbi:hypothetical protein LCI18_001904 [Fusarium solani-melongenae]|uniref:Uncharacterized protein n=1 Tax=Fusarium solani subsp. cucurbitae TaxID=2747967 RepID=A0ACD3YPX1_FUSSC|nr:hypothetical protein LCI18_001904 [Fusarium solani-melongenae]